MNAQEFRDTTSNFASKFFHLIQGLTYVPYFEVAVEEPLTGQYFVVTTYHSLFYNDAKDDRVDLDLLYFKRSDSRDDTLPDPNRFFKADDELFTELSLLAKREKLNSLSEILPQTNPFVFSIEARFASQDFFIRNLLEELILIFYCSEARLSVDCMLNQRKRVRIEESQRTIFCVIPYDKAEMFQTATVIKDNISNIGP